MVDVLDIVGVVLGKERDDGILEDRIHCRVLSGTRLTRTFLRNKKERKGKGKTLEDGSDQTDVPLRLM